MPDNALKRRRGEEQTLSLYSPCKLLLFDNPVVLESDYDRYKRVCPKDFVISSSLEPLFVFFAIHIQWSPLQRACARESQTMFAICRILSVV